VLVARGEADQGLLAYTLGSDGRGAPLIMTPMGGTRLPVSCPGIQDAQQYLRMDGRPVFKWAIRVLQETSRQVLQAAGVTKEDIRLFLVHQANTRIIDAFAEQMQIDREKIVVNMHRYGNTSAASIPICLDEACASGAIQRGDLLLLSGFGAGLVWGTGVLRW
jgi:3-oxoacyl-[acyl-carrier-protein] synthase-3